jgi:hypothetical protein
MGPAFGSTAEPQNQSPHIRMRFLRPASPVAMGFAEPGEGQDDTDGPGGRWAQALLRGAVRSRYRDPMGCSGMR